MWPFAQQQPGTTIVNLAQPKRAAFRMASRSRPRHAYRTVSERYITSDSSTQMLGSALSPIATPVFLAVHPTNRNGASTRRFIFPVAAM
jgi:hypothetical protein